MSRDTARASWTPMQGVAWLVISALAFLVGAYSFAIVIAPDALSPFAADLLARRPVAAPIHFVGGAVALLAGTLQVNRWLRTRFPSVHRWLGRVYVLAVAGGGVSALALALTSSGGFVAASGFGLLGIFWLDSTLIGYRCIRRGDRTAHRRWMIRSYALTFAAVTLRLYMPLSEMLGLPMSAAYPAISWLAWVPNLLVAEWLVRSRRSSALAPSVVMQG